MLPMLPTASPGASGWYLMVPPLAPVAGTPFYSVNDKAPLNTWEHRGSFDSVGECDMEQMDATDQAFKEYQRTLAISLQSPTEMNLRIWRSAAARWEQDSQARCIASDDPRLK